MTRFTFAAFAAPVAPAALADITVSIPSADPVQAVDDHPFLVRMALVRSHSSQQTIAPKQDGQWQPDGRAMPDVERATGGYAKGTAAVSRVLRGRKAVGRRDAPAASAAG